jgi:hypothetical protein
MMTYHRNKCTKKYLESIETYLNKNYHNKYKSNDFIKYVFYGSFNKNIINYAKCLRMYDTDFIKDMEKSILATKIIIEKK